MRLIEVWVVEGPDHDGGRRVVGVYRTEEQAANAKHPPLCVVVPALMATADGVNGHVIRTDGVFSMPPGE